MITIKKVEVLGLTLGIVLSGFLWVGFGRSMGVASLIGMFVSLSSLHLSYSSFKRMLTRKKPKSIWKLVMFGMAKLGILIALVPFLIIKLKVNPIGFIVGFSSVVLSIGVLGIKGIWGEDNAS